MWPNSWKKVTTSLWKSSAGLPSAEGAGKLHNMQSTGTWSLFLLSRWKIAAWPYLRGEAQDKS
jgi:hypothetical protein